MTEVVSSLSEQDARALTNSIAAALNVAWDKIVRAYELRAWEPLGYATWDAYCAAEFGSQRLRLPAEERAETVQSLQQAGLSTRAIASATGTDKRTVSRDLASAGGASAPPDQQSVTEHNEPSPGRVGLDGRVHPAAAPHDPERAATKEVNRLKALARQRWSATTVGVHGLLAYHPAELIEVLTEDELDRAEELAASVGAWGVELGEYRSIPADPATTGAAGPTGRDGRNAAGTVGQS